MGNLPFITPCWSDLSREPSFVFLAILRWLVLILNENSTISSLKCKWESFSVHWLWLASFCVGISGITINMNDHVVTLHFWVRPLLQRYNSTPTKIWDVLSVCLWSKISSVEDWAFSFPGLKGVLTKNVFKWSKRLKGHFPQLDLVPFRIKSVKSGCKKYALSI